MQEGKASAAKKQQWNVAKKEDNELLSTKVAEKEAKRYAPPERGLHSRERGMGAKREYNLFQQQKKRMHQPKSCSEGRVCA